MSKIKIDTHKLTRIVVVRDPGGRIIEDWNSNIAIEVQDDGRTLKVFYSKKKRKK